jgi:hypothetical protein
MRKPDKKFIGHGPSRLQFWLPFVALLSLSNNCAADHNHNTGPSSIERGSVISAVFGSDGRLWRVIAGKKQVYVDYSSDLGKSFSPPVLVNAQSQRIKATSENRPAIAADGRGNVYVIYPAEGEQPVAVYASISVDDGKSFSAPKPVSAQAEEAYSLNGALKLSPSGKAYVFWLDERDREDWRKPGNALYYAVLDGQWQNGKIAGDLCECCRLAVDFDTDGSPVLLTRFIYPGGIRDHGLVRMTEGAWASRRVTFDDWHLEGCPDHGPSLSIGPDGARHFAWFTQGTVRQGLFYAHSDQGDFSPPMAFGDSRKMPGHAAVLSQGSHIFLSWKEFDGGAMHIMLKQSRDGGNTWTPAASLAKSSEGNDYPLLLSNGRTVFLSWHDQAAGYRLIPLN